MDLFGGLEALRVAAGQRRPIQVTRIRPDRGYALVGAQETILTGAGRLGPPTTDTHSWFYHRRFSSPVTKE